TAVSAWRGPSVTGSWVLFSWQKASPECGSTGYVQKITCSSSKRSEFRSCRSALMEQHLFWKFEGAVVSVALVFACLVIIRQRQLDRKALEKVRKQIESI
ncbi:protein JTB, partial [Pteropus vampyrus]|uniref:Protein JTB n=1 Tax=Pteropus vampyrus TaxID=132908 RepID=A0A6P3QRC1_PTEVA